MKVMQVAGKWGIDNINEAVRADPSPGENQVVVRMAAASLNYRDYAMVQFRRPEDGAAMVPCSDGVGTVTAVGAGVSRVAVGDRVCPMFFQSWYNAGDPYPDYSESLGNPELDGVLQEQFLVHEDGVSKVPAHLNDIQAATLPCAALTAWRAVHVEGKVKAGDWVLLQGTGGVSIFALQFAKAKGANVIITSSSDQKLARAAGMGADCTINYKKTPNWADAALELTDGQGVNLVVEVGGADTVNQAIKASATGGTIALIGLLSGTTQEVVLPEVFRRQLHIAGILVGSRVHFEEMAEFISEHAIEPVVDETFSLDNVQDAFRTMEKATHFGKIAIEF